MIYISDYHSFEGKYSEKESPLKRGTIETSSNPKPVEGSVVLLLSKPFVKDGNKRLYMGLIKKVRQDNNSSAVRVDLMPNLYILKEYSGGLIMPEPIEFLKDSQWLNLLGMKSSGIYLNDNKTPLWTISCDINKLKFFKHNQDLLKSRVNQYEGLIYPATTRRDLPNLH